MTELRDAVAAAKEFLEWVATDGDETVQVIREDDVEAAVTAAISAWNRRADAWQPIETAPRDNLLLLWNRDAPVVAYYHRAAWRVGPKGYVVHASHWRPLPKEPGE